MAGVSDEELAAKKERVAELREELAKKRADRSAVEAEMKNDAVAAQLDAEEARLKRQLDQEDASMAALKDQVLPTEESVPDKKANNNSGGGGGAPPQPAKVAEANKSGKE